MSQFFIDSTNDVPPPVVATSYVTDNGTAIPSGNILNVNQGESSDNNILGIATYADPDLSNNLRITLTNRIRGQGTTVNTGTSDVITFSLGSTPGSYSFEIRAAGYSSTGLATAYSMFFCIKTNGTIAAIPNTPDILFNEDSGLGASDFQPIASGNNLILRATGVAAMNINWAAVGLYTFALG